MSQVPLQSDTCAEPTWKTCRKNYVSHLLVQLTNSVHIGYQVTKFLLQNIDASKYYSKILVDISCFLHFTL